MDDIANRCGVSTDWLSSCPRTSALLRWRDRYISSQNRLNFSEIIDFEPNQLLNDEELEAEFSAISKNFKSLQIPNVENYIPEDEEHELNDLKEYFAKIQKNDEHFQEYVKMGKELDADLTEKLALYQNIKCQKLAQLKEITNNCDELTKTLENEKRELYNIINDEINLFLNKGKENKNKVDDSHIEEYFKVTENLCSYINSLIKNQHDSISVEDEDEDSVFSKYIDLLLETGNKTQNAIRDFIKLKSEASAQKEVLKFYLNYKESDSLSLLNSGINIENDTEMSSIIHSFIKYHIEHLLNEELKIKETKLEYCHEKFDIIHSFLLSLFICGEILLASMKNQVRKKEDIIKFFFSTIKFLINDIVTNQNKNKSIEKIISKLNENDLINNESLTDFMDIICKIFSLNNDLTLKDAINSIKSTLKDTTNLQKSILQDCHNDKLQSHFENEAKTACVKEFIWDGPTLQPNMCNKKVEYDIYQYEKRINCDSDEVKSVTNKYIQLKENFQLDSTLK